MKGSLSWRNNNPGNLRYGIFTKKFGAISESNGFAVFPNYETGFNALTVLLKTKTYRELDLYSAMNRYAPKSENDTENYIKFIELETGFNRKTKLKDIDINKLALTIQKFEGWIPAYI